LEKLNVFHLYGPGRGAAYLFFDIWVIKGKWILILKNGVIFLNFSDGMKKFYFVRFMPCYLE